MARSMRIIATCDGCGVRGEESDFEMDVVIDVPSVSKRVKETDLCTDRVPGGKNCFETFTGIIKGYLDKARNSDAKSRIPKPEKTTPATPAPEDAPPELVCDIKGCARGPRGGAYIAPTPRGLSMHKSQSHGIKDTAAGRRKRGHQIRAHEDDKVPTNA